MDILDLIKGRCFKLLMSSETSLLRFCSSTPLRLNYQLHYAQIIFYCNIRTCIVC